MTDLGATYQLSRGRFDQEIEGLSHAQLNWRPREDALSIAEMAVHLAGVEIWFSCQIKEVEMSPQESKLAKCAVDGVVNEAAFPFSAEELTSEFVAESLAMGRHQAEEILNDDLDEWRNASLRSALGPEISGEGAMHRFAFHPAYHQGQAYLYKTDPNFPTE